MEGWSRSTILMSDIGLFTSYNDDLNIGSETVTQSLVLFVIFDDIDGGGAFSETLSAKLV